MSLFIKILAENNRHVIFSVKMRHPSQEAIFFTNMLKKANVINEKTINQKKDDKMTTNMLKRDNAINEKTMNERNCIF